MWVGKQTVVISMIFILICSFFLVGCESNKKKVEPAEMESLLRQAGFELRSPKDPEQLKILNTMPPDKLVSREYKGKLYYLYQDPLSKNTVYVGTEQTHARLMELVNEYELNERHQTVARSEDLWSDEFDTDPTWDFLDPLP